MKKYKLILVLCLILFLIKNFTKKNEDKKIIQLPFLLEKITFLDFNEELNRVVFTKSKKSYVYCKKIENEIKKEIVKKIDQYYVFKDRNKYGLLDDKFNIKLNSQYDKIERTGIKDLIIIEKNKKMKLLSLKEKFESTEYDSIKKIIGEKGIKVTLNKKQGYIDQYGNILIDLKYKYIFPFKGKIAVALKDKYYGVIDEKGEIILPFEFDEVYIHENGNILTSKDGKYLMWSKNLDNENKNLVSNYKVNRDYEEIEKLYPSLENNLVFEKNNRFGVLKLENFEMSKITFEEIEENPKNYTIVAKNEKYGIYNIKDADKKVDFIYDYILRVDENIFKGGTLETGLYSLILKDNEKVTEEIYTDIKSISKKYVLAFKERDVDIYLLKSLEKLITLKQDEIVYFDEKILALKNGKLIIIK